MALSLITEKALKFQSEGPTSKSGYGKDKGRSMVHEQRNKEEKFGEVKRQCDQLREETQLIMRHSTSNRIRLILMLNILQARQDEDFDKAAILTRFLKFLYDRRRL